MASLPRIDAHTVVVDAATDEAWTALLDVLDGALSGRGAAAYASVVGCEPSRPGGPRPLRGGSTIPGFSVTSADPGRELVLAGRHRFSIYELTFRLRPAPGDRTAVEAESRAAFPGPHGRLYRLAVVGTGFHALAVRRLLESVRRRADDTARRGADRPVG